MVQNTEWYSYECEHANTQPSITSSKLTIKSLEQGVKYVQN